MGMNQNCDVSVVIPAYCAEKFIHRALDSVLSQTILPKEIIVVDDGSTDNTLGVVNSYKVEEPSIRMLVFTQPNKGAGAARNLALKHSNSKYIAFLDSDDEWLPTKLETSLQFLETDNYDLVAHNVIMVTGQDTVKNDIAARFKRAARSVFYGLYCRGFIGTSTVVTTFSAIKNAGLFDETLKAGQDFDLWLKMLGEQGSNFIVFDQYLTRNYIRSSSITRDVATRLNCTLRIARRHAPKLINHGVSPYKGLIFRVSAVHYEAFKGHLFNAELFSALFITLKILPTLMLEIAYLISTVIKGEIKKRTNL